MGRARFFGSAESNNGTAGYKTTFTYDALDRTTKIQQTGQTGGNTVGTKRVDLYYNAAGQRWYVNRYADTAGTQQVGSSTSTFDQLGRLTALDHKKGTTNLANYTWTYDAHSRITNTANKDGSTSFTNGADDIPTAGNRRNLHSRCSLTVRPRGAATRKSAFHDPCRVCVIFHAMVISALPFNEKYPRGDSPQNLRHDSFLRVK